MAKKVPDALPERAEAFEQLISTDRIMAGDAEQSPFSSANEPLEELISETGCSY